MRHLRLTVEILKADWLWELGLCSYCGGASGVVIGNQGGQGHGSSLTLTLTTAHIVANKAWTLIIACVRFMIILCEYLCVII